MYKNELVGNPQNPKNIFEISQKGFLGLKEVKTLLFDA